MSVELEPTELGFRRPFTHEVSQELRLTNPHDQTLAFKVKTTAPKQYCVRPNSGTIPAKSDVSVQVLLQAMKEDPPLDARCRDKFLVQTAPVTSADSSNLQGIWSEIEKTAKSSISERKIRVTFLPATDSTPQSGGATAAAAAVNGTGEDSLPAYRSPSPAYGSPAQSSTTPAGKTEKSAYESAATTASAAVVATKEQLQVQLEAAKAQILQLKSAAESQGLRQRKTDATAQDSRERTTGAGSTALATQSAGGVPVQIVAALCLLSFLLAYFFF